MPLTLLDFLRETEGLSEDFDPETRRKGTSYAALGRVKILGVEPRRVTAEVRGTRLYEVGVRLRDDQFESFCSCPRFADGVPCKHLFATLVELKRGYGTHSSAKSPSPWKQLLIRARARLATSRDPGREEELLYVLDPADARESQRLIFQIFSRRRKAKGAWGNATWAPRRLLDPDTAPDPTDRAVLSFLNDDWNFRSLQVDLSSPLLDFLLPLLAKSGRFRLMESQGKPEDEPTTWDDGEPWRVALKAEGDQGLSVWGRFERGDDTMDLREPVLLTSSGHLFARRRIARFMFDGAFEWLFDLRRSGPMTIPKSEIDSFVADALGFPGGLPFSLPESQRFGEVRVPPRPILRITSNHSRGLGAAVSFDYLDSVTPCGEPGDRFVDLAGRRLLHRDREAEARFIDALRQSGFRPLPAYHRHDGIDFEIGAPLLPRAAARLIAAGWRVEADGVKYRAPGKLKFEVSSGVDWFDLKGGVEFGDQTIPFPALLKAARKGESHVVLGDGSFGVLPEEWMKRSGLFLGAAATKGDALRFRPGQAVILDALLASEDRVVSDPGFVRARRELRTFESIVPADPPKEFLGELRPYQKLGLGWFEFLRRFGWGGCLADDMGLGKTVQALALLSGHRGRPSLIVVPRSLVFNWRSEAARFAPHLKVMEHGGLDRDRDPSAFAGADIVLTTYGILRRDAPFLKDVAFDTVILDEAQAIKNPAGATAKAARLLNAERRLAMSGTPIENHLGELWSLMEFLNPGLLGAASVFRSVSDGDAESRARLARALRPFILRRTKEQVAPELPPRSEQTVHVDLDPAERRRYDELKEHYRRTLLGDGDFRKSKFHALEALLRLRQAACHGGLIDPQLKTERGTKLEVLIERLREVAEEGHKALVFSQFTSLLAILKPHLDEAGLTYEYLDGATRDREERVRRFQSDPACPFFLISLKAGGLGLNLTAAEYVFLLDPWWNPASEAQAIDRAHRIGQLKPVMAMRLVARDTVEERVIELQRSKRELADSILNADGGVVKNLTREDLRLLLS